MAGIPGLEPGLTESESAVLPLDDIPILSVIINFFMQITIGILKNLYILNDFFPSLTIRLSYVKNFLILNLL